jgi:hypothetical protein
LSCDAPRTRRRHFCRPRLIWVRSVWGRWPSRSRCYGWWPTHRMAAGRRSPGQLTGAEAGLLISLAMALISLAARRRDVVRRHRSGCRLASPPLRGRFGAAGTTRHVLLWAATASHGRRRRRLAPRWPAGPDRGVGAARAGGVGDRTALVHDAVRAGPATAPHRRPAGPDRHDAALHDYRVAAVSTVAPGLTEITLAPLGVQPPARGRAVRTCLSRVPSSPAARPRFPLGQYSRRRLYPSWWRTGGIVVRLSGDAGEAAQPQAVGTTSTELNAIAAPVIIGLIIPGRGQRQGGDVVGERPAQVAPDDAQGAPRQADRVGGDDQIAADQGQVGGFERGVPV